MCRIVIENNNYLSYQHDDRPIYLVSFGPTWRDHLLPVFDQTKRDELTQRNV